MCIRDSSYTVVIIMTVLVADLSLFIACTRHNTQCHAALGLLYLVRTGDNLVALKNISGVTVRGTGSNRAELPNFNSSTNASSNNLLAYYPNYRDAHRSGLAAMFINMPVAFPCLEGVSSYLPVCKVFTYEDDGFRGGRAIIEAGDSGNGFPGVFNGTQKGVFAFGFTGCPEFDLSCFPRWVEYGISCYLPRNICG